MNCPFCKTENPDRAVYCKNCGKPVSGSITCHACGEEVPADGTFCIYCGTRLTPLTVSDTQNCAMSAPKQEAAQEKPSAPWQSILTHIGGGCALFAALCAVIFTFCLGCSVNVSGGGFMELSGIRGMDAYYYFGEIYSDLNATLSGSAPMLYVISLYCGAVFGTLLSAAAFVTVPTLFIVTLVRYILSYSRQKKPVIAMAAKTYFIYLAFALLFFGLQAAQIHASSSANALVNVDYDISVTLNAATIAGIVLGAVGIALSAACNAIGRGAENTQKPRIVQLSVYGTAVVLVCIAVSLLGSCLTELAAEESGNKILLSFGLMKALSLVGNMDLSLGQETSLIETYPAEGMAIIASAVLGTIFLIALLILAAILLASLVRGIGEGYDGKNKPMKYAIFCTVFVILLTVCTAVLTGNTVSLIGLATDGAEPAFRASFTSAIVAAVLFAAALVLLIVYTALSASKDKKQA